MLRAGQRQPLPGNESSDSNTRKNQQFQGDNQLINLWVGAFPGSRTPPDGQGCSSSQTSWRPPPKPACPCRMSLPGRPPRHVPADSGPPFLPFPSSPPFCPSLPTPHPLLAHFSLPGGRRLGEEPQVPAEEGQVQRRQDLPQVTEMVPRIQLALTESSSGFSSLSAARQVLPLTPLQGLPSPHTRLTPVHVHTPLYPTPCRSTAPLSLPGRPPPPPDLREQVACGPAEHKLSWDLPFSSWAT